jgi:para-aminobenzoate synthetase
LSLKTLIIDNYDSFTFNLFQQIAKVSGEEPLVVKNDQITLEEIQAFAPTNIVISPGPGRPENIQDFGICQAVIESVNIPLLGVCLGHQGLVHTFGGKVIHAPRVMHGRLSEIYHDGKYLFAGTPQGFSVVRYHSLIAHENLPDELEATAWTESGIVMGLRHKSKPFYGIQFHPESILTQYGDEMVANFFELTKAFYEKSLSF